MCRWSCVRSMLVSDPQVLCISALLGLSVALIAVPDLESGALGSCCRRGI
ncbi:hypothetical protein ACQKFE_18245 [Stutzerimonas stutzeri]|jgi:hypothetical protein|nr:hypothetical protein [Pseudomonas aeruginosa]